MRFFKRPGTPDIDLNEDYDLGAMFGPLQSAWTAFFNALTQQSSHHDDDDNGHHNGCGPPDCPTPAGSPDIDLTAAGSSGVIGGAVFMSDELQPAGSGDVTTFVSIQHKGSEQGYNSDAPAQLDEKHHGNHSLLLADVPIVLGDGTNGSVEGVAYREFVLKLNEPDDCKRFVSLDALQIWQEEAGDLTNFTPGAGFDGVHTNYLAYDLDAGGDRWVALADGHSHGGNSSDYRVLIPNSLFINDAAHRYVTLYSAFGVQGDGWRSEGGFETWGVHAEGDTPTTPLAIQKTATVPGGTADTAGEAIGYAIAVSNIGDTALTGITVTDPSVSDLAAVESGGFNVGDTNLDGALSVGETWQYTASHTVTQNDIDSDGGGDGSIDNTATADSAETDPVSAAATVAVERTPAVDLVKTADVASVDAAGDAITYSITVTNTGNTTLTFPVVTDSQVNIVTPIVDFGAPILGPELLAPVLVGDYNVGDTNQNGIEDPGETFQFANPGDFNQNGIEDPGETFEFTNVGDTNQNGSQDTGETFQFYNAGDTNQNGVEDPGETFQFDVSHEVPGVDADFNGFNDGDVNSDGALNVGEIWQYALTYTVTQDDIDNGGVVDPLLTHDNTASVTTPEAASDESAVSVAIVQDPRVTLTKAATVQDGTADQAGDVIDYTITVTNDGNMTLTGVVVTDSLVSLTLTSGDDSDGILDLGETWIYTASYTVTQDDIDNGGVVDPLLSRDNTASVTTDQAVDPDAADSDSQSVPIVQNPHVTLTKSASVPGGTADQAGEVIDYAIAVTNDGNMTLAGLVVSDPSVGDLAAVESGGFNAGDTDQDGALDLGETWQYTASHTVTQDEIDAGGSIENAASVATDQGAASSDGASVTIVQNPLVTLTKEASVPGGTADTAGEVIDYAITVSNDGNVTLTGIVVSDPSVGDLAAVESGGFNVGDADQDGALDLGETWQYTASHTVTQAEIDAGGSIDNTASVATDQGAMSSDGASVAVGPPLTLTFGTSIFVDHDEDGLDSDGDLIEFVFTVTNAGSEALSGVTLDDPLLGGTISGPDSGDDNSNNQLDAGETWIYSENYFLTASDVTAHHVLNEATVAGLDPLSQVVSVTAQIDFPLP